MKKNRHFVAVKTVMNIQPKLVRNDTLADRNYLVVPMVMLVEGVHEGSEGAYLYTNEEMGKRVEVWNRKPVVVYHPDTPSACTKEVLNTRWIGDIMNSKWDKKDKRLLAEAWLDEERVKKVDNRILEAINNEETIELSTGLFADSDETAGEWEGEEFQGTLSNYGPDHLAVLPDQVGACSVEDGAGFYRNQEGETVRVPPHWSQWMAFHFNELGQNDIRRQLEKAIFQKGEYRYVEDVIGDTFIWSSSSGLYRQDFKVVKDVVSVIGAPTSVVRKISYEPITNAAIANKILKRDGKWYVYSEDGKKKLGGPYTTEGEAKKRLGQIERFKKKATKNLKSERNKTMDKDKETLVNNLISAKTLQWEEDDREYLENLDEDRLKEMQPKNKDSTNPAKIAKEEVATSTKTDVATSTKTDVSTQNVQEQGTTVVKPLSEKDYMAQMPEGIRNRMQRLERMEQAEQDRLIEVIKKNPKNTFAEEWLKIQDVEMLQNLANIAAPEEVQPRIHRFNYGMNANTYHEEKNDVSDVPVLNTPGDANGKAAQKKTG